MQKFHKWLADNPGMTSILQKTLAVNATCISNVRHGRRPMPTRWMPEILRVSDGRITIAEMVLARNKVSKHIRLLRRDTAGCT